MNSKHPTKPRPGPTIVCSILTLATVGLFIVAVYSTAPLVFPLTFAACALASAVLTGMVFESYVQTRRPYVKRLRARERGDAYWQNRAGR